MKKRVLAFLCAVAVTMPALCVNVAAEAEYLFNEDFENYNIEDVLDSSQYYVGGGTAVIVANPDGDGNVLSFTMGAASRITNKQPVENLGGERFVYEFQTFGTKAGAIYAQFYTGMAATDAHNKGKSNIVAEADSGKIYGYDNAVKTELGSYTPGEWMSLKTVVYEKDGALVYDLVKQNLEGKGEILATALPFSDAFAEAFKTKGNLRIRIMANAGSADESGYVDNSRVYIVKTPVITDTSVDGILKVGTNISLDYNMTDDYNDGDISKIEWYRDDELIEEANEKDYIITEADFGKTLKAVITPQSYVSLSGEKVEIVAGVVNQGAGVKPVTEERKIAGDVAVNNTVSADYIYKSDDEIPQSIEKTEINWYMITADGDVKIGEGKDLIIPAEAADKYIYYTVKPVDEENTIGDEEKCESVYVPLPPYVSFGNVKLYKGFGSVKNEISGIRSGTVSIVVPYELGFEAKKGTIAIAKLYADDKLAGSAYSEIGNSISGEFKAGFNIPEGKKCRIELCAYNNILEKKIVSGKAIVIR